MTRLTTTAATAIATLLIVNPFLQRTMKAGSMVINQDPITPIILTIRSRRAYAPATAISCKAHLKERHMGSKQSRRREFLKGSAALVGGLLGTAATAVGQTPASPPMIKGDKDLIA